MSLLFLVFFVWLMVYWYKSHPSSSKVDNNELRRLIRVKLKYRDLTSNILTEVIESNVLNFDSIRYKGYKHESNYKYNGVTCLDGTPDLRYKFKYYTLKQSITYEFEALKDGEVIKSFYLKGNGYKDSLAKFESKPNFQGVTLRKSVISKLEKEVNMIILCFENELFLMKTQKISEQYKKIITLKSKKKILNTKISNLTHRISELENLISSMSKSEVEHYEELKKELTNYNRSTIRINEKITNMFTSIKVELLDIKRWIKENKSLYLKKLERVSNKKKIKSLLNVEEG